MPTARSGDILWSGTIPVGKPRAGRPTVFSTKASVCVSYGAHRTVAYDTATGKEQWRADREVVGIAGAGLIAAGFDDGWPRTVVRLDPRDGSILWETPHRPSGGAWPYIPPGGDLGDRVIVSRDSTLLEGPSVCVVVDSGELVWEVDWKARSVWIRPDRQEAWVQTDVDLVVIDTGSGQTLASWETDSFRLDPVVTGADDGRFYCVCRRFDRSRAVLRAFDLATHELAWESDITAQAEYLDIRRMGDRLYVPCAGAEGAYIICVDPATGAITSRIESK